MASGDVSAGPEILTSEDALRSLLDFELEVLRFAAGLSGQKRGSLPLVSFSVLKMRDTRKALSPLSLILRGKRFFPSLT